MRRPTAAVLLSVVVPALLVVPTVGRSAAEPRPVAPTLSTVDLRGVDEAAWAAELAAPAPADQDVAATDRSRRPDVFTAPLDTAGFGLVGITWDFEQPEQVRSEDLRITVRTRSGGTWLPWATVSTESVDSPAAGEGAVVDDGGVGRPTRAGSAPYVVGRADGLQVRVDVLAGPMPVGLRADLVDPGRSEADDRLVATAPSAAHAAVGMPAVITRAQWGADESLRNGSPTYEPRVKVAFVHHTASSSNYAKKDAAGAVRSLYAYATNSLGWSDIAYNVIVDQYGQVFEGRHGGLDAAVRSGATGGFNGESWSVSALGNFVDTQPSADMVTSLEKVLAWKLGITHRDPRGTAKLTASGASGTTSKYPDGTAVRFDVISGHRDAGYTACPGAKLFALLPSIRSGVEARMGAQLYGTSTSPKVVPKGERTPVRVEATVMADQEWRLEARRKGDSQVLRSWSGTAAADETVSVDWNLEDGDGRKVDPGVYTLTLQSWTADEVAVPYAANVLLFADPDVYERPADGVFELEGRGYGHGHGMSQFGAEGAARSGLTRDQILAFYYPGTKQATAAADTTMRVNLTAGVRDSDAGPDVKLRPVAGLQVSEGERTLVLPAKLGGREVTAWRTLLKQGRLGLYGFTKDGYRSVSGWTGREGPFRFTNAPTAPTTARVTLIRPAGGEPVYRGSILVRANAAGTGLNALSLVLLDDYVKSVISAELPGGWTDTAYQAQAVAARSYALFKRAAAVAAGSAWHICDTTQCQVYNGYSGETSPESKASTATAGRYLAYGGSPIFAEYSSANGGWSSDGGKPYLVAQEDPYDGVVKGTANWGHAWDADVSATRVQNAYPAVGSLQRIVVTDRTGLGEWGGRVTRVRLEGSAGTVTASGTEFRSALGLKSEWFRARLEAPAQPPVVVPEGPAPEPTVPPSVVRSVTATGKDRALRIDWSKPADDGGSAVTGYRVTVSPGDRLLKLPSSARSVTIDRLVNGRAYEIRVTASNSAGRSRAGSAVAAPGSSFGYQVSVPAAPVFSGSVVPGTDQIVEVLGRAGVPTRDVAAVTLRVTATNTSGTAGWVKAGPAGTALEVAQQQVPAGGTSTNLVLVPPNDAGALTLRASTDVRLDVEVVGYQTLVGGVGRRLVAAVPAVVGGGVARADEPLTLTVAGRGGVHPGTPAALLQVTVTAGGRATTVTAAAGGTREVVPVVSVPAGQTRTVPVVAPLSEPGRVRLHAAGGKATLSVDVHGALVADDGLAAAGRTRALAPVRLFDSRGPSLDRPVPVAGSTLTVPVLGRGGVPASGVSAVVLNVLAVDPTRSGELSVYPAGAPRPGTRSVTYASGATVRTTVVAKVGAGGAVQVHLPHGGAHVFVDVAGWVSG